MDSAKNLSPLYIGSDHAGFALKEHVQNYLKEKGYRVVDLGVFESVKSADYPDIAREVAEKVRENPGSFGVLMCGTGIGMCMAANKVRGIRAANCESKDYAAMSRKHNDANILCLGGRHLDFDMAIDILDTFLATQFESEERHARRVRKIDED